MPVNIPKHFNEDGETVHCQNSGGDDRTLCGVILEGIGGQRRMTETHERINCRDCIQIIEHCYRVRPGAMVITRRDQRRMLAVGIMESYLYLVESCTKEEAWRRIKLLRAAMKNVRGENDAYAGVSCSSPGKPGNWLHD